MEKRPVVEFSYERVILHTNNLNENFYLGQFQFGKLYRGEIHYMAEPEPRHIIVKMWDAPKKHLLVRVDNNLRLMDELVLLRHEVLICHPGMVRLFGFCFDGEHIGAIYELKALDSVYNLIPKDCFTWLQRIKVVLGLASLLKFLHAGNSHYKPFIVGNLDAAHVLLDEDYNPKLCDFGMITGGIFPDRTVYFNHHVHGCRDYFDLCAAHTGKWSTKQDVFAFGAILLGLISKRVYTREDIEANTEEEFVANIREGDRNQDKSNLSLVHPSLAADPEFCPADGRRLMDVVAECTAEPDDKCPSMKQILRSLLKLKVVEQRADFLEVNKFLCPFDNGRSKSGNSRD